MQWLIIIIALVLAIPTYGISLLALFILLPILGAKTRSEILPQIIRRALNAKQPIEINDVYFEAAEKYALDTNNVISHDQGYRINFYALIDGEKINVMITDFPGGFIIGAKNNEELGREIQEKMDSYGKRDYE